ncbi:hypothetical protein TNCV_2750681 [Trichonephila clavipes]|nr:hypothetical protein TNCV_2750681 [Trichonephila clavipes]
MLIDHGTSSELQPSRHRWSKDVDPLGFSTAVQRYDSRKAADLKCKLDVPGRPTFYGPVHRHVSRRHATLHCRAE